MTKNKRENKTIVKNLLEDFDLAIDEEGYAALKYAIILNKPSIVTQLLENGANPSITDKSGNNLLHLAAEISYEYENEDKNKPEYDPEIEIKANRNKEIVQILIEKGVDTNKKNSLGHTPLRTAEIWNNNKTIEEITNEFKNKNKVVTKLKQDIKAGNIIEVKNFIKNGNDINMVDERGDTPIILAIKYNKSEICKFLFEEGADINKKNHAAISALTQANLDNNQIIIQIIQKEENQLPKENINPTILKFLNKDLDEAIKTNDIKKIESLIQEGATTNEQIDRQIKEIKKEALRVRLKKGTLNGDIQQVDQAIEEGADINAQDNKGNSPLLYAIVKNQTKIAKIILNKKPDIDLSNNKGRTPLQIAAQTGNTEIMKDLLKTGANTKLKDKKGFTINDYIKNYLQTSQSENKEQIAQEMRELTHKPEIQPLIQTPEQIAPGVKETLTSELETGGEEAKTPNPQTPKKNIPETKEERIIDKSTLTKLRDKINKSRETRKTLISELKQKTQPQTQSQETEKPDPQTKEKIAKGMSEALTTDLAKETTMDQSNKENQPIVGAFTQQHAQRRHSVAGLPKKPETNTTPTVPNRNQDPDKKIQGKHTRRVSSPNIYAGNDKNGGRN